MIRKEARPAHGDCGIFSERCGSAVRRFHNFCARGSEHYSTRRLIKGLIKDVNVSEEDGFLSCCAPLFSSPRHIVHAQDFDVRESASEGQQRIGAELDSRQVTVPHGRTHL